MPSIVGVIVSLVCAFGLVVTADQELTLTPETCPAGVKTIATVPSPVAAACRMRS